MTTGVLLTGFGGPDSIASVAPFMCNLMGKEPSEELVQRVCRRYLAIGGSSPLTEIAGEIASELHEQLTKLGKDIPVAVGMRYWDPYIRDGLVQLKAHGCDRVVTVSLSPFESKVAHGAYREAIAAATAEIGGLEVVEAPLVSSLNAFADYFAGAISVALTDIEPNEGAIVVFTAHSLPESDLDPDDPYVTGLIHTANSIAETMGMGAGKKGVKQAVLPGFSAFGCDEQPRAWFLVYQSKGNRPGPWLGPDLDELIDVAAASGVKALVVCPIGFMTDHMETLYDLDIVAADKALEADLEFIRVPVPNQHMILMESVAKMVADLA
ncbi:MAG: ferrochelatase [Actinobacteria bacterium HGW-Actinobacteria-7]|nr:MAG: ferrochelatase [Actinobacteria bacterium HGW-Actinobacteria-7]